MSTPLCPRSFDVGYDHKSKEYLTGAPCMGSRCAAWSVREEGTGACGLALGGQRFIDPSRPTTRQTTPKPKTSETRA